MAFYNVGDTVRSRVNAQGMTQGTEYVVADVLRYSSFLGVYFTYILRDGNGTQLSVGNGHFVLDLVCRANADAA